MESRPGIITFLLLVSFLSVCSPRSVAASGSSAVCRSFGIAFVIGSQCPAGVDPSPALEVSGEFLDMALSHGSKKAIYAVLFHASWCPFSQRARHVFDVLSYMYPHIGHLAVEESSSLPSVFSRYGVHSFPTILLVNGTRSVRYQGPKDQNSIIQFYRKVAGFEPIAYISRDQNMISEIEIERTFSPWDGSPRHILKREPYLVFGIFFICTRAVVYVFPAILYLLKLLRSLCSFHLNTGIFEGSYQLLERTLHLIDMKRLWNKLGLSKLSNKTRNLQKGANNARVWASSLTSVSLGESSSSRNSLSES